MARPKQYTEEEVIEKAMNVFWKNGYASTSIRELEREMGINQFSIYSSFGSKKGVFIRALDHYRKKVKEIFLADLIKSDGRVVDIRKFLKSFVQSVKSGRTPNGCLMANTAMAVGSEDEEVKVQLTVFFKLLKNVFKEVLQKAKDKHEISMDADIEAYANYLLVCTEGLAVSAKVLTRKALNDFIDLSLDNIK